MELKEIKTCYGHRFRFKKDEPHITYIVIDGRGYIRNGGICFVDLNSGRVVSCAAFDPLLNDEIEVVKELCDLL